MDASPAPVTPPPPRGRLKYTQEQLQDIAKLPASQLRPANILFDVDRENKHPLAITWGHPSRGRGRGQQLVMRRELPEPAVGDSYTPRSSVHSGTQRSPGANKKPRMRTWKQVYPIAQYQVSDQRNQTFSPSSTAEPTINHIETLLQEVPSPEGTETLFARLQEGTARAECSSSVAPVATPPKASEVCKPVKSATIIAPEDEAQLAAGALARPLKQPPSPGAESAEEVSDVIQDPNAEGDHLSVSVLHATDPIMFTELREETNLNKPPPNWLQSDDRVVNKYNPGAPRIEGSEFMSSALAAAALNLITNEGWESDSDSHAESDQMPIKPSLPKQIDVIAPAENLKKLFMVAHDDAPLALTIHKIGESLVLEDEVAHCSRKNLKNVRDRAMFSKLLYYSILAEQTAEAPAEARKAKVNAIPLPAKGEDEAFKHARPWHPGKGVPGSTPNPMFTRTLHWRFQDLNLLLGSNTLVMKMRDQTEVALKMRDTPLSQAEALSYWLDNVMTNVPNVAICFHKEGIIQGYQLVSTADIPRVSEATRFDPKVVEEYCGSVLHWLKDNCISDAGSYLLVREKDTNLLQLYDLAELYGQDQQEDGEALHQRPFAYSVGMMCFRMGDRLLGSSNAQDQVEARELLLKSVEMVAEEEEPALIALAHEKIATTYLFHEDDANDGIDVSDYEASDPDSSRRRKRRKKKKAARAKAQREEGEAGVVLPTSSSLITLDTRRDYCKQAIDHLTKGMQVLAKHSVDGEADGTAIRRMRERHVHCYLDMARLDAVNLNVSDAFKWMDVAIEKLPTPDSLTPDSSPRPAAEAPEGDAGSTAASSAEGERESYARRVARRVKFGIYHILADLQYAIASKGNSEVESGERPLGWLQEHERRIADLLAKRRQARAQANGAGPAPLLQADVLLATQLPLSNHPETCYRNCLQLYDEALALTGSQHENQEMRRKQAGAQTEIAKVIMARGELDKARAMFLASLDTWKALGDVGNQVLTLNNIGRVDHALAAEEQKANVRPDGPKSEPRGSSPLTPGSGAFQPPAPAPAAADAGGRGSPQPEDAGHVVQGVAHARGGAGGDSGAMAGNMSVREENLRYSAIRCFSDAAALLGQPDTQRSAAHLGAFRKVTEGNLAFAYFELAARLKQNFVALFSSHKDVEKAIADMFLRSITLYELAGQAERKAFAQCYVASLYFSAWQNKYLPMGSQTTLAQLNERRFKFAEMYYRKALQYYVSTLQEVHTPGQLNNMVPRVLCALAELYRYAHASNGTRSNLEKAIAMHQECKTWFVVAFRLMESPTNRRKSVLLLSPSLASPCLTPKSAAEQAQLEHLKALIAEQSALVCKYVKEDLMLFLKANRPTAQEYQSAKLAYSLALKSNDILQILDSVQRIKCKPAFPIIKPETLPILKGMLA